MFTLRFETPSGRQWYFPNLYRAEVEQKGAIALRFDAVNIEVVNLYGTDVTFDFAVFRNA
jgi:hypothetical protein